MDALKAFLMIFNNSPDFFVLQLAYSFENPPYLCARGTDRCIGPYRLFPLSKSRQLSNFRGERGFQDF